jgi:hypothetical protein
VSASVLGILLFGESVSTLKAVRTALVGLLASGVLFSAGMRAAGAHCDSPDGPVGQAVARALETGNVNHVLIWVKPDGEAELREAFRRALAVRKQGTEARELADRAFLETAVRIHRAGEGAPYTGLKPAGRDLGPAIPAADRALAAGNVEPLVGLLEGEIGERVRRSFGDVRAKAAFDPDDVAAGRSYVEAYVRFIHLVERLHEAARADVHGHFDEGGG